MAFDQDQYVNFLISNHCVEFYHTPIRLKCGRLSWWDANLQKLYSNILLKRQLANYVYQFAQNHHLQPDLFLGVPMSAIPLGECVNELIDYKDKFQIPATILRSEYKVNGNPQHKYAIGPLNAGDRVVLVDDTVVTGSSFMRHIPRLQELGVIVEGVIVCVYRFEKRDNGRTIERLLKDAYKVDYSFLTDARVLLTRACNSLQPEQTVIDKIESYYQQYGVQPVYIQ
ncbi:MAG: phosphoribosyltransferase family protein [Candidatus Bathyarchaeota archaeon]|jgi:orotate phosphoribosyltransferase|nr:phosphoribosyltransferase family protein [Candidatus Bathyarchaeota archaeon]